MDSCGFVLLLGLWCAASSSYSSSHCVLSVYCRHATRQHVRSALVFDQCGVCNGSGTACTAQYCYVASAHPLAIVALLASCATHRCRPRCTLRPRVRIVDAVTAPAVLHASRRQRIHQTRLRTRSSAQLCDRRLSLHDSVPLVGLGKFVLYPARRGC